MLMSPKRYHYGKLSKNGRIKGGTGGTRLLYGTYGLIAVENGRLSARQLEAARRSARRGMSRVGRLWVRLRPLIPVTKKPGEVRMGGGSGSIKYWATMVKPGMVLMEMLGVDSVVAMDSLRRAACKLPVSCKIVQRAAAPL